MDRHNRPQRFAAGAVLVGLAAVGAAEWPRLRAWCRPPVPDLPAPADVIQTQAVVWASGSNGNPETDVPWFSVPASAAPRLWKRFQPNSYVIDPPVQRDAPLGEMLVVSRDNRTTRLRFYETGPDEVVFTVDGEDFYRAEPRDDRGSGLGGGLLLAGTLRHAAGVARRGEKLPDGEGPGPSVPRPDAARAGRGCRCPGSRATARD